MTKFSLQMVLGTAKLPAYLCYLLIRSDKIAAVKVQGFLVSGGVLWLPVLCYSLWIGVKTQHSNARMLTFRSVKKA